MKVTVTVRLIFNPCDKTSIMLSVALCVLLLNSFSVVKSSSANLAEELSFFSPLDESQNVKLYWNVDTAKREIVFTVEAKTTGWVGFGISSGQGKMEGADIVIGWVKDGQTYFKVSNLTMKLHECRVHPSHLLP